MSEGVFDNFSLEVLKGISAKFAMAVFGFVGTIIFARLLGPTDFGGYYLLLAMVKFGELTVAGLGDALKKRFSEARADEPQILGAALVSVAALLFIAIPLVLAVQGLLISYTGVEGAGWLLVLMLTSLALFGPSQSLLGAKGLISRENWIDMARSVLTLLFQLVFVLQGYGPAGMAYGFALATFATTPLSLYFVRVTPTVPSRKTLVSIWRYARYSVPTSFIGRAYSRYDVILLGILLGPAAVSYYEVALRLTIPGIFISGVASSGLMARVSKQHSKDEPFTSDVTNTLAFASLVAIPLFFGALALPDELVVTLYGQEFADAAPLLIGLALFHVVRTQATTVARTIKGYDRPDVTFRVSTVTLVFNVITGYLLVLEFGAVGVVVATVLAELARYVLLSWTVAQQFPSVGFVPRPFLMQVLAALVMFVVVTVVERSVPIAAWTDLVVVVALGAAVYFAAFSVLSRQFRQTVTALLSPAT